MMRQQHFLVRSNNLLVLAAHKTAKGKQLSTFEKFYYAHRTTDLGKRGTNAVQKKKLPPLFIVREKWGQTLQKAKGEEEAKAN